MKRIKTSIRAVLMALPLLFALPAYAAETSVFLTPERSKASVGDTFETDLILTTGSDAVNAVEGTISFPGDLLELKGIKDGNSIMSFWIERPESRNGEVRFSGVIPGGYVGTGGRIFSIDFQAKQAGAGIVAVRNLRALLNDGKGTDANASAAGAQVTVTEAPTTSPAAPAPQPAVVPERPDHTLPETFEPVAAHDPSMFGGKYFLVFGTQDKESGIDHYEVCEGTATNCTAAESPYVLRNQTLSQDIIVKAFDRNGNERDAQLSGKWTWRWPKNPLASGIIGILGLILFIFWRRR